VTPVPRTPRWIALVLLVLTTGLALVSCSAGKPASQAVLHIQKGVHAAAAAQPCQLHQTAAPTSAYRGGQGSDPSLELPFLAYFTANGNKQYCDGKPPTDIDRVWARLYVQLTDNSAAVHRILSG
jgi:hypothetical protein